MRSVTLVHKSWYSYEGTLETPNISHSTVLLSDFAVSWSIEKLSYALNRFGVIPPRHLMNEAFARGRSGKAYSWEPFQISEQEYAELSENLINNSNDGFIVADESLWSCSTLDKWFEALRSKISLNPTFKRFSWDVQHALIGIPVSETQWIPRNRAKKEHKTTNIDGILRPLERFFRGLEHCTPHCCAIEAYNFYASNVLEQADNLGRNKVAGLLDRVLIDFDELDDAVEVVSSELLNDKLMKQEMRSLIEHFLAVLSRGDQMSEIPCERRLDD